MSNAAENTNTDGQQAENENGDVTQGAENTGGNEQQGEQGQQTQVENVDKNEVEARQKGWVSKEEWVEQGKDPDEWMNARHYNEKGDLINRARRQREKEREFDQRLADNNAFWKAQIEREKEKAIAERDNAVELADLKTVKEKDAEIAKLDQQAQQLENSAPQLSQTDIEAENAWFEANKTALGASQAKLLLVQNVFDTYSAQGYRGQDLTDIIDKALDKEFPPVNPQRQTPGKTESKSRSNSGASKDLTVDSLTAQDKDAISAMRRVSTRYANKSDAEMLKILQDSKR